MRNTIKWLLLITSAAMYAFAFLFNHSLWWMTFLFLTPLYYIALADKLSFNEGLMWGIIAISLHLMGVFYSIVVMAEGAYIFRIVPIIGVTLYVASMSGIVFWLTTKSIAHFKIVNMYFKISLWVMAIWFYFYLIDRYCLWPFGCREGYPLMHPLLPLIIQPRLLLFLPIISKPLLTLIACITAAMLTLSIILTRYYQKMLFLLLALSPWLISFYMPIKRESTPSWLSKIVILPERFYSPINLSGLAEAIQGRIKQLLQKNPQAEIVLLPEGALFPCNLAMCPELGTHYWTKEIFDKEIHIILGANRWEDNRYYNTIYWLYNGTIQKSFDKRHGMLLTERLPEFWNFSLLRNLYFVKWPPFTPSSNPRELWHILPNVSLVPYICSEIFFNEEPDDHYMNYPILSLCNDRWVKLSYVSNLMLRVAQFKAIQWQRDIVYLSFQYAGFITRSGVVYPLSQ